MSTIHLERAPAKLTRTLEILGRRDDGYHLLRSEMVAIDLFDDVWIDDTGSGLLVEDAIAWRVGSGSPPVSSVPEDGSNLVQRALRSIGREAGVRLVKRIPPGAGLGGGSSDAAAVLRAFGVDDVGLAASLGADVPFCLAGGRALVSGIGEELVVLDDLQLAFVIVTPGFQVSTAAVYAAYDELGGGAPGAKNHLEPAALAVEPRLAKVRDLISLNCALEPTLAGSGASYFVECGRGDVEVVARQLASGLSDQEFSVLVSPCSSLPKREAERATT